VAATWAVGWAVIAAVGLLTPELFSVLTSSAYRAAERVFPWLLLTQLMTLMQYPVGVVSTSVTVRVLCLWSTSGAGPQRDDRYTAGVLGGDRRAAAAWFIANAAITVATWILAQRVYPLPWRPRGLAVWGSSRGRADAGNCGSISCVGSGVLVRLLVGVLGCGAACGSPCAP